MSDSFFSTIDGTIMTDFIFDKAIASFNEGYAIIEKDNEHYYLNHKGEVIQPESYSRFGSFYDGLAIVVNDKNQIGYMDKSFNLKIPIAYEAGSSIFRDNQAIVQRRGERFLIDREGNTLLSGMHIFGRIYDNRVVITNGQLFGYVDSVGDPIISCDFDVARDFHQGNAVVMKKYKCSIIDQQGSELIPYRYNFISPFTDGIAYVKKGKKYGFINSRGGEIIALQYDEAKELSDGLAPVRIKEKWGFIDSSGALVIEPQFDKADPFRDGYARIMRGTKWGFVDTNGGIKEFPQFSYIDENSEGFFIGSI